VSPGDKIANYRILCDLGDEAAKQTIMPRRWSTQDYPIVEISGGEAMRKTVILDALQLALSDCVPEIHAAFRRRLAGELERLRKQVHQEAMALLAETSEETFETDEPGSEA